MQNNTSYPQNTAARQANQVMPGFPFSPTAVADCHLSTVCFWQVVLLVDQSLERQQAWDAACTTSGTAFYSTASRGACTYLFANLHQHTFTPLVSGSSS